LASLTQVADRCGTIVGLHNGGDDGYGIRSCADGQGRIAEMDAADGDDGEGYGRPYPPQFLQRS
jgi:hypothetical protein